MSKRRRLLFWVFISIALVLILLTGLPRVAEVLVKYQLQSAGVREPVVHIEEIGLQGARISKLAFNYNSTQHRIDLQSEDIQLTYNFTGLLSGRLDQIVVSRTDITVESQQVAVLPETAANKAFSLPSVNDLPFRFISLQYIQLVNKQADKDVILDITGDINVGADQAKAQMKIAQHGQDKVQANLFLLDSGDMRLLVYDPQHDDSLLDLSASRLSMLDNYMKTTLMATMDLEKISDLLDAWGIELAIKGLTGTLMARGKVSLPVVGSHTLTEWLQTSQIQAEMDIKLAAQHWSGFAREIDVNIPLHVSVEEGVLKWDFDKHSHLSLIPLLRDKVDKGALLSKLSDKLRSQKLHIKMPDGFSGEVTVSEDRNAQTIDTQQAIHLRYGDSNSVTRFVASIHSPRISMYPSPRLLARLLFTADSSDTAIAYADSVQTQGEVEVSYSNKGLELNLQPETMLSVNKFIFTGVNMKSFNLKLISKAVCGYKSQPGEWYCGELKAGIIAPEFGYDQHRMQSAPGSVHVKSFSSRNTGWQLKANTNFRDISIISEKQTIKLDRIRADIAFNNEAYAIQAKMYAAKGAIDARLKLQHNPASGKGNMDYRLLPVSFKASKSITDQLFGTRYYPLQFDNGTLAADGRMVWRPPLKDKGVAQPAFQIEQNTNIQLTRIAGRFKKTLFKDLNAALQLQGWERFSLKQPVNIRVAEINPGIAVTDISLLANMDYAIVGKQAFTINKLSAQTLGGEITGDDIYVDLDRKHNPFKLKLSHLDIARLLELEQNQGIYGTGYIDGELPFDFSTDGLSIRDGKLMARAPGGKIQYKANERVTNLAKSNTSLAMLLQALTDFSYKELVADANYDPDGTMLLKVRLKGANPEFQQGRPVHLNVNVEENVLQLIRSIQLGDEISEKIGERVLERKQKD